MKKAFKKIRGLLIILTEQYHINLFKFSQNFLVFLQEYITYLNLKKNPNYKTSIQYFYPCLTDKTGSNPINSTYFFQDTWAAGKIFQLKPQHHYDIGSSIITVGIISQFVPTTMVDIRAINISLKNLFFKQASILNLPFEDNSIESISSLCVVEHIGLGRYGDQIDPWGSEKAIRELKRVLKDGGNLLFSVPVDQECRVYFNAHRSFTREYLLKLFEDLKLVEEKYIYETEMQDSYDQLKGFGTGLYHFRK
jgi:SAM-dependent methyltransferase